MTQITNKAYEYVKSFYAKNDEFHSMSHIDQVLEQALKIMNMIQSQGIIIDEELLSLAVIFHDANYHSGSTPEESHENHPEASVKVMKDFLVKEGFSNERIAIVEVVMLDHSGPHRRRMGDALLAEGKIIYDADKSILISDKETYDKYFTRLYFDVSRELVLFKG